MESKDWLEEFKYTMLIKVEIVAIVWSLCWVYSLVNLTFQVSKVYLILAMLMQLITAQYFLMVILVISGIRWGFVLSLIGIPSKEIHYYRNLKIDFKEFFVKTWQVPVSIIAYNVMTPYMSTLFF